MHDGTERQGIAREGGKWWAMRWLPAAARRDRVVWFLLGLVIYSVVVYVLAVLLGFHEVPIEGIGYETYFDKPNWWGYPFFFVFVAPALWLSWTPFLTVWGKLADTGVLTAQGAEIDADTLSELRVTVASKRWIAVAVAIVGAIISHIADLDRFIAIYEAERYVDQLELAQACRQPDFAVKWLLEVPGEMGKAQPAEEFKKLCRSLVPAEGDVVVPSAPAEDLRELRRQPLPAAQIVFVVALLVQQFAIVLLGFLAFGQLILHAVLFALFDRLAFVRRRGLRLALNPESPLREFGLEHWNHALNNVYWALTPALAVPVVSRLAHPDPELYLPTQHLMTVLIPLAVLGPIMATIISRQVKLPEVWERVQPRGPVDPEAYLDQRLWPLDKNWSSKLGILLAAFLASLMLGLEITEIMAL